MRSTYTVLYNSGVHLFTLYLSFFFMSSYNREANYTVSLSSAGIILQSGGSRCGRVRGSSKIACFCDLCSRNGSERKEVFSCAISARFMEYRIRNREGIKCYCLRNPFEYFLNPLPLLPPNMNSISLFKEVKTFYTVKLISLRIEFMGRHSVTKFRVS